LLAAGKAFLGDFMGWVSSLRLLSIWLFCFSAAGVAAPEPLQIKLNNQQAAAVISLAELKALVAPSSVQLYDPNYQQQKHYQGISLWALLQASGYQNPADDDELVVTALDGYAPVISLQAVKQLQPLLVFAELSPARAGREKLELHPLTALPAKQKLIDPGPLYLVWPSDPTGNQPWPYQVVKLEVSRFADRYAKVIPKSPVAAQVEHGFSLFKQHCLRCHAINQQGGQLGPELNIPQNVTEYWQADQLPRFIRRVSAFRLNSKMPDFNELTAEDAEALVSYLTQMRHQKQLPAR